MSYYPDFFNDVFGPIMQPGSSSHMAAPCRLGKLASNLLGGVPVSVEFIMDQQGSFAGTFGVMNEDKGMLAGVLGLEPEDERIYCALELAKESGIEYHYVFDIMKESDHLNAIKYILHGADGNSAILVGDSTGGGMVRIKKLDGYPVDLIGDSYVTLIFSSITDIQKKSVEEYVDGFIQWNVSTKDGKTLEYFLASTKPKLEGIKRIIPDVRIELLEPVLPVVMQKGRKPQLFRTVGEWLDISQKLGISMSEASVRYEMNSSLWSRDQVINEMNKIKDILFRQISAAFEDKISDRDPFQRYDGRKWNIYQTRNKVLSGTLSEQIIKRVIGVNAKIKGVPIVPGPMGTGGGYLFSVLYSVKEAHGFSDEDLLRGLFVAAGIGALAYTHTNPTGEVVGCAGECGVCCAMTAAAIVEMAGQGERIDHAASLALQAFIGIPCDPVIGGYEVPCFSRIMTAASMSVVYADLALAGVDAIIPYDEMLKAIDTLGKNMSSELLCTSAGGCCVTPTAKRCESKFRQWRKQNMDKDST